jgi:hypothetical protein
MARFISCKNHSEGEGETECWPVEVQVFHKFTIAEIVVQVPIAEHHGKPIPLLSTHGLTSRLKPKVASLKNRIDIPDFQ